MSTHERETQACSADPSERIESQAPYCLYTHNFKEHSKWKEWRSDAFTIFIDKLNRCTDKIRKTYTKNKQIIEERLFVQEEKGVIIKFRSLQFR